MAHYGYLDPAQSHQNGHSSRSNGHQANGHKFSAKRTANNNFVEYVLYIFDFILLSVAIAMAAVALLYRSEWSEAFGAKSMQMAAIRSLLPLSHPLNVVHWSMLLCAVLIATIAVMSIVSNCSSGHDHKTKTDKNSNGHVSPSNFDMEIVTSSDEEDDDDATTFRTDTRRPSKASRSSRTSSTRPTTTTSSKFLACFIFSLLLLFTIQLAVGAVGFLSAQVIFERQQATANLTTSDINRQSPLLDSFRSDYTTNEGVLRDGHNVDKFDRVQRTYKCCGLIDYSDYSLHYLNLTDAPVPRSCCKTDNGPDCGQRRHPSNIFYDGCVFKLERAIKEQLVVLSSVALGLSVVELFGLMFSCCLYVKLVKSNKEWLEVRAV